MNPLRELPLLDIWYPANDIEPSPISGTVTALPGSEPKPIGFWPASSKSPLAHSNGGSECFTTFAFSGEIEVKVRLPHPVVSATLRPSMSHTVPLQIDGDTVCFILGEPRYLCLEINYGSADAPWHTIYILPEPHSDEPQPGDEGVKWLEPGHHTPATLQLRPTQHTLCLAPGVHTVEGDVLLLRSHSTLHLRGGAHLRAYLLADDQNAVQVRGPGILDGHTLAARSREWRDDGYAGFVFFRHGTGHVFDGPIIYDSPFWNLVTFGTNGMRIRNYKSICWRNNTDGIQPRSCNDLRAEHCFLKCNDDCVAIKTRRAAGMTSRGLHFRDLVLWNDDWGNALEIGHTSQADLLEDVIFENIEVIHAEGAEGYTLSIAVVDHCLVRHVRFENIFVEGIRNGDFRFRIIESRYSTDLERGRIQGVTIRNYRTTSTPTGSIIAGYDNQHLIEDVTIEDFASPNDFSGGPLHIHNTIDALRLQQSNTRGVTILRCRN